MRLHASPGIFQPSNEQAIFSLFQVGETHSSRPGEDDARTLKGLSFQTGDFLDVAIKLSR